MPNKTVDDTFQHLYEDLDIDEILRRLSGEFRANLGDENDLLVAEMLDLCSYRIQEMRKR